MAKSNKQIKKEEDKSVGQAVGSLESFLKDNSKMILNIILGIVVVIAAIMAINKWYVKPAKQEAMAQMFAAESHFRSNDFEKALNGDGNSMGFLELIDQYGKKGGRIIYFYAGVCQLQLGEYTEAINLLKKYSGKDDIISARALCCLGDAYAGNGNNSQALSYYEKAVKKADNIYTAHYLFKAGITAEEMGNNDKALKFYQEISDKYPQSIEAQDINKYIYRIKNK